MIALSKVLERIDQLAPPGIVQFFGSLPDDPWQKAMDSLEQVLTGENDEAKLVMLDVFQHRILALINVYLEVLRVSDMEKPIRVTAPEKGWHIGSVNYSRGSVCCDSCLNPMSERRGMIMKKTIVDDPLGESEVRITAFCDRCYKPKKKESPRARISP